MEFFERAHVHKATTSSKRETKTGENVKKQLKQMLYGYKQSDNQLIKNSANLDQEDDDSSVSGFSDLNLTNSSVEADTSHETGSVKDTVYKGLTEFSNKKLDIKDIDDNVSLSMESDGDQSLSNDLLQQALVDSSLTSEDLSLNSNLSGIQSADETGQSESFDADGVLAATILKRLNIEHKLSKKEIKSKTGTKRKNSEEVVSSIELCNEFKGPYKPKCELTDGNTSGKSKISSNKKYRGPFRPEESDNDESIDIKEESTEVQCSKKANRKLKSKKSSHQKFKECKKPELSETDQSLDSKEEITEVQFLNNKVDKKAKSTHKKYKDSVKSELSAIDQSLRDEEEIVSDNSIDDNQEMVQSPPFISVTADEVPNEDLGDLLGDYRHSVFKNKVLNDVNVKCGTNPGLFSIDDLSISSTQITDYETEEVGSLIPEVDNDTTIEDLDIDISQDSVLQLSADITDLDLSEQIGEVTEGDSSILPIDESSTYDTLQTETSERYISTELTEPIVHSVRVYYAQNSCIIILKHPTELYIHGKVRVTCLAGTIEIFGYTLQTDVTEVYAPNYGFGQYIRTLENLKACYGLFGKLTSAGLKVSEAEEIVTSIGDNDGIVYLQRLDSTKFDFVESNFSVADLFSKPSKNIDIYLRNASEILGCSLYLKKPWKSFIENPIWKEAIYAGLGDQSRGIICGGKSAGKSTFLRYYINQLLSRSPVLLLDLDPGQCEMTVAGNISASVITTPLLGPNFTHLKTPDIMLHIGMINTMDNPRRYIEAVERLVELCAADKRLAALPWVVNTMGMCNAMGLKFITLIILKLRPTFVVQLDTDTKNQKKTFGCELNAQTIRTNYQRCSYDPIFRNVADVRSLEYEFIIARHQGNAGNFNTSLAPKDERYLSFLAYFGELLQSENDTLLGIVPYEVNLKDVAVGANVKVNGSDLMKVINGKIVALCQHQTDSRMFTLRDKPVRCLGHGIVRGVDWEKEVLYVITPVPASRLEAATALVYADWAPELLGAMALRGLPAGTAPPYRTAARYHQRQLTAAPKRRFNPIQLLKMSRSA